MQFIPTEIPDVVIIEPRVFSDARGYFFESWREDEFVNHISNVHFIQENESKSTRGVLRGLHFQAGNNAQAKLVRVVKGCVIDVAVDCRRSSKTFGRHVAVELSGDNHRQLFIPRGFAHGFITMSDEAVFTYKVDNYYAPQTEQTILWNDKTIAVEWPQMDIPLIFAPKDLQGKPFLEVDLFE